MKSKEKQWAERWERAQEHPWPFIRDFVCTKDEHDMTPNAAKKPAPRKVYLRAICRAWFDLDVMLLEKSRQIWMTWLFCSLFLWLAMKPAKLILFQSKEQDAANKVLRRSKHIYRCLYRWRNLLPNLPRAKWVGQKLGADKKLVFPEIESEIVAIPQGPEVVAGDTISGLFADEMDLQVQWLDGYSRAMPAISGGGRYTGIGSANGKTPAWRLLYDIDDRTQKPRRQFVLDSAAVDELSVMLPNHLNREEKRYAIEQEMMHLSDDEFNKMPLEELFAHLPGMRYWLTADGNHSLRVHYTADPDKDPITKNGKTWVTAEKQRMKYHANKARWDREYEIKRTAHIGRAVIGNWDPLIFVPQNPDQYDYDDREPLYLGVDFGTIQCNCLFSQLVRLPFSNYRQLRFINEIVLRNSNTPELAEEILRMLRTEYKVSWVNNRLEIFVDPAGNQPRETTSDRSNSNSIQIFQNSGLYVTDRKLGLRESTEHLETAFMTEFEVGDGPETTKHPAIIVHPRCIKTIEACEGGLHYPEKETQEGHYEKDGEYDHIGDAMRHIVSNVIDPEMLAIVPETEIKWAYVKTRQKGTGRVLSVQKVRVA